jgi:signal transduction histidine kinase
VIFNGAPEMIAQMLDKLVANAVEFSAAGTPIVVRLNAATPSFACRWKTKGRCCPTPCAAGC